MNKYSISNRSDEDCTATFYLLQIIQRKYVGNILAVLSLKGAKGFGELQRELKPISSKVLSQQLKFLVSKKIISKSSYLDGQVKKSLYTLSHQPEDFKKILLAFKSYSHNLEDEIN